MHAVYSMYVCMYEYIMRLTLGVGTDSMTNDALENELYKFKISINRFSIFH